MLASHLNYFKRAAQEHLSGDAAYYGSFSLIWIPITCVCSTALATSAKDPRGKATSDPETPHPQTRIVLSGEDKRGLRGNVGI
jgi:hypothetical protein